MGVDLASYHDIFEAQVQGKPAMNIDCYTEHTIKKEQLMHNIDQRQAWESEYQGSKGIPTTTRNTPSSAVKKLLDYFKENRIVVGKRVIDLGCGVGRNATYLAKLGFKVAAIGFAESALAALEQSIANTSYRNNITPIQCDLTKKLPFENNSFDLALDIVTTMSLKPEELKDYENELRRIVRPSGYYLTYTLSDDDGYLQTAETKDKKATFAESGIIDHYFSEQNLRHLYTNWDIMKLEKRTKLDILYGREYTRQIWWMLLKNGRHQ